MEQQGMLKFSEGVSTNFGSLRPIVAQQIQAMSDVKKQCARSFGHPSLHKALNFPNFRVQRSIIEPRKNFSNQLATTRLIYLPPQWSDSIHPEGGVYFHRNSGLHIVTGSYLYNPETAENISAWVRELEEWASKKGFVFTDHTELFLQLDGNDCNYYFVDHGVRMLFWLDAYDTSELGISPVVSSLHLSKPDLFHLFLHISDILS